MGVNRFVPATLFALIVMLPFCLQAGCFGAHQDKILMEKMLQQLPQNKRRFLRDTFKRIDEENDKLRDKKEKLEAELGVLLTSPTFDKRTYLDKSAKLGTLRAKMRANVDDAVAQVASQYTLEERKLLMKIRKQWHGSFEEWANDDEEDNHQPAAE